MMPPPSSTRPKHMKRSIPRPPKLAERLLWRIRDTADSFSLLGDMEEDYVRLLTEKNRSRADLWYWKQIFVSFFPFLKTSFLGSLHMLKNFFKISLRILKRYKGYSFINIGGLTLGITCCLLIFFYIQDELSYDRFHINADRLYRVVFSTSDDDAPTNANGSFGVGPALKRDFPEVVDYARIRKMGQGVKRYIGHRDKKFYEQRFFFADPQILTIFDFPLVKGDPETALNEPGSIVLTEETAYKYFGREDPMGKTIESDPYNNGQLMNFRVTGIAKNTPTQSHFHFDFLASYISQTEDTTRFGGFWQHFTYILLDNKTSAISLEPKLLEFLHRNWREDPWYRLRLQPITDIHLRSGLKSEIEPVGNISTIYVFTAIALLVLIIACINFMNLTTARSTKRAREVGMRKVVGARRQQLIHQFLGESMLFSFFAVTAAVIFTIVILPFFNRLTDKQIEPGVLTSPIIIIGLFGTALLVGLAAGIYPALFLSSFKPIKTLKTGLVSRTSGNFLRKGLVTFQFALSIGMIIRSRDLGYDKKQIMVVPLNKDARSNYAALREELLHNPNIENTATSSLVPTRGSEHMSFKFEGKNEFISHVVYFINKDFIETLGIKIIAGNTITETLSRDAEGEYLISELSVKEAGFASAQEAVGKGVTFDQINGFIAGVVNDMNIYSLRREPYAINYMITPIRLHNYLSLRLRPQNISPTLEYIVRVWNKQIPAYPLSYFFLDDNFENMHRTDQKMSEVFTVFSILAILVACLGLFGLAAHTAEQKTKEIGIRKVLGAPVSKIYLVVSQDFLKWVAVANLIAWPLTYYLMQKWLQSFVYRIELGIGVFLGATLISLLIAALTISYQSIKAALSNPIESLRYE